MSLPSRSEAIYPVLFDDLATPTLKVYPVYNIGTEKFHAMPILDLANSRMKDLFDIATIAQRTDPGGAALTNQALQELGCSGYARKASPWPQPAAFIRQHHGD